MLAFTRLRLASFGSFRNAEYLLKPGFNFICGNNETGKSTFAAAIAGVIFGFRRDRDRYVPWGGNGGCEAEVAFAYDDREMTVCRDFIADRVRAEERQGDKVTWRFEGKVSPLGRSSDREEYLARIETIWGFSEGDIFRNSVYVGQRDLSISGEGNLGGRLQQLLSGFSEMDYDGVISDLEKELHGITKKSGGRAKERELEEVRARIAQLSLLWQETRKSVTQVERREAALAELSAWCRSAADDLEKGGRYLEKVASFHGVQGKKQLLQETYQRIDGERSRVENLLAERADLEHQLTLMSVAAGLPDDFPVIYRSFQEASDRLEALETDAETVRTTLFSSRTGGWGKSFLGVFLVICLAIGWFVAASLGRIAAVTVAILFVVIAAPLWRRAQARTRDHSRRMGRLEEMEEEIASLQQSTNDFKSRFSAHAGGDAEGLPLLLEEFEALRVVREKVLRVESALEVLPDKLLLDRQWLEARRELAVVDQQLQGVHKVVLLSPEEYLAAEEKLRRLEAELKEKQLQLRQEEQELAVLRGSIPDLRLLEDEGEELRDREARLQKRVSALRLASEVLRESLEGYRSTYLSRFAKGIAAKMGVVTAGRYRDAACDAAFNLSVAADGAWRPIDLLSCGAQDQAYLAARLALGGVLSRGKNLPFLLDDPLVNFDDERRYGTLQMLNQAAGEHQILFFSHDPRYGKLKAAEKWHRILLKNRSVDDGQLHLL